VEAAARTTVMSIAEVEALAMLILRDRGLATGVAKMNGIVALALTNTCSTMQPRG
jgi:hypothetical protein